MCHVRKLELIGNICGRDTKVSSYYSWPLGEKQYEVERIVEGFKKAFCNVNTIIHHMHLD